MSLQPVPGVRSLLGAVVERNVGSVPLVPHLVGACVQHGLDLVTHLLGGGSLTLGPLNVVIAEAGPGLWHGHPVIIVTEMSWKIKKLQVTSTDTLLFFFFVPQLYSPFLGEMLAYVAVFNPTTEVVTFRFRGWAPYNYCHEAKLEDTNFKGLWHLHPAITVT